MLAIHPRNHSSTFHLLIIKVLLTRSSQPFSAIIMAIPAVTSSPSIYSHAPSPRHHGRFYAAQPFFMMSDPDEHLNARPYGGPAAMSSSARQDEHRRERDSLLPIDPVSQDDDIDVDYRRCSLVSGPRVTKYGEMQWEDFNDSLHSTRQSSGAFRVTSPASSSKKNKGKSGKERPGTSGRLKKSLKVIGSSTSGSDATSATGGLPERPSVGSMMLSNQSFPVSALLSARRNLVNLVSGSASPGSASSSQMTLQPLPSNPCRLADPPSDRTSDAEYLGSVAVEHSINSVTPTVAGLLTTRCLSNSTTSSLSSSQGRSGNSSSSSLQIASANDSSFSSSIGTASTSAQDRQRLTTPEYLGVDPGLSDGYSKPSASPIGLGLSMAGDQYNEDDLDTRIPFSRASESLVPSPSQALDRDTHTAPLCPPTRPPGPCEEYEASGEPVYGKISYRAPQQAVINADLERPNYPVVTAGPISSSRGSKITTVPSPYMDEHMLQGPAQTLWSARTPISRNPSWEEARAHASEESMRPVLPPTSASKREDKVVKGKKSIINFFKGATSSNVAGSTSANVRAISPTPKISNSTHIPTPHLTPWPSNASGIPRPSRVFPPPPMPLPLPSPTIPTPEIPNEPSLAVSPSAALTPRLELRPVSMLFSNGLPPNMLLRPEAEPEVGVRSAASPSIVSCLTVAASSPAATEISGFSQSSHSALSDWAADAPASNATSGDFETGDIIAIAKTMRAEMQNARKAWLVQICELQSQVRELKLDLAQARTANAGVSARGGALSDGEGRRCEVCECRCLKKGGIMDRGRARTGGARGVFGSGSLYEWE